MGGCNGGGGCVSPSPSPCPNGFICDGGGTFCKTSCGSDPECASSSDYCDNPGLSGKCTGKVGDGAGCSANNQCSNGTCCTTPPSDFCADADTLTVYSNLNTCSSPPGTCSYPSTPLPCSDGCSNGACNGTPSFVGDATATSTGGTVTLVQEKNLDPSTGNAPAVDNVVVSIQTMPSNGYQGLTLNWTNNEFVSTTPVTMMLQGQSGGIDTWTATIPGQSNGTTVRFYIQALKWNNSSDYSPGNLYNFTYVASGMTVSVTSGVGTLTSSPAGLSCSQGNTGTCTAGFDNGVSVTLTPSPLPVKAWGAGPCSGNSVSSACTFTFNAAQTSQSVSFYSALSLSSGGSAQAADKSALNPGSITVEAWIKPSSLSGGHVAVVQKGNPFSSSGSGYYLGLNSGVPEAQVIMQGPGLKGVGNCPASSSVVAGVKHHLALTYNASFALMSLYVDGKLVCTNSPGNFFADGGLVTSPLIAATGSPLNFGGAFAGSVDEVRISNTDLYSLSNFTPPQHASLLASTVGLWHFDEGTGSAAADSSTTGDNAALSGSNSGWTLEP
jgi:hypothetical protein